MDIKSRGRRQRVVSDIRPTQHAQSSSKKRMKTKEIRIVLPSLPSFITRIKSLDKLPRFSRKTTLISGVAIVIAIAAYFGGQYLASDHSPLASNNSQTSIPATKLQQGTPDYPTVLPSGKTIQDLGGWTRVSPPDRNPVFAYIDKIGAVPINVSQQPLPDDFKNDADQQVEQLAGGYKANEKITVGSISVHIGTSAKGPQSVIFNKNNLLVLIKSSVRIDNDQWAAYVNSLQ